MSVLLRQPHGFEGFLRVEILADPNDLATLGTSTIQAIADSLYGAALVAASPEVTDGDDSLAKVPESLFALPGSQRRLLQVLGFPSADALVPPVHGGFPAEIEPELKAANSISGWSSSSIAPTLRRL